jgi:ribosomal protein L37AE/L43A
MNQGKVSDRMFECPMCQNILITHQQHNPDIRVWYCLGCLLAFRGTLEDFRKYIASLPEDPSLYDPREGF